ncbi:MAG: glycosyltransferase [Alphaproteobacteria bacterium]|nr:glycosyltransferase [Alphaproteobacteria bacterium]NCQ88714.1 glycosyltransferase [Alphaproteobacteria bacterium]NCT08188.1 glycosyltransferase [Alphaproteobacteria bacterium]
MRILQVMAGGEHGGAEMAFVDMCIAMKQAGVEVQVVTRANKTRIPLLQAAGLKVDTLPFGGPIDKITPFLMTRIIKKFEPDIVQTWMSRGAQKVLHWTKTKTDKPYINVARLGGYYPLKHFKNSDFFITITPDIGRHLKESGVDEARVRFIQNFAETENDATPVSRGDLKTPKDALVLLTLARLHESKAIDVVLKALQDLPNAYLWVAGEGPLRGELEDLAKNLSVYDRVRFLGWRTDRSALLQAADICLFTSRYEPFGTVFAQSWASKTPVIVTKTNGPSQFCEDGVDSIMIEIDDKNAMVAAIHKIANDKVLQMNLVNNGYKKYLDQFTKEKSVGAYLDYYQQILYQQNLSNSVSAAS